MSQPDGWVAVQQRALPRLPVGDARGQHHGWRVPRSVMRVFLTVLVLLAGVVPAAGQSEAELEYKIKAVYLLNFTRFVEWPQSTFPAADSPFRVCVAGQNPFGKLLDEAFHGENVQSHPVVVDRLAPDATARDCQLLFIARLEGAALKRLLQQGAGSHILTVSDMEGFIDAGGAMRFFIENGRVRFEVNPDAASQAGLRLSSRLLSVARVARPRAHKEGSS